MLLSAVHMFSLTYARYSSLTVHAKHDVRVDTNAVGHGKKDLERPRL
jgi:hypothetical protein